MKLYVGNLPHSYKEQDLKQLFAEWASVISCKIIMDRETGRSKGFGFVEFSSKEDAIAAIAKLNGKEAGGRPLVVNEARPQEKRDNNSMRGGPSRFNRRGQ